VNEYVIQNAASELVKFYFDSVATLFQNKAAASGTLLSGMSLSTFKRKFKETYDASPAQCILEKRLNKVAERLRVTDDPVSHIGYTLGFESPEHLSRSFKRHFGNTPSAYRLNPLVK
ncbi:MAG: AraC family transcriptional regulator, partial [Bacteroidota bacterium]